MVIGHHGVLGQLARDLVVQGAPLDGGHVPLLDSGAENVRERHRRRKNATHTSVRVSYELLLKIEMY